MKKYIITIVISLIAGFMMSHAFLSSYKGYEGIKKKSIVGEELYFLKLASFNSKEEMEESTLKLANYIYKVNKGIFDVYVGITSDVNNIDKLKKYYKTLGYEVVEERYLVTSEEFINSLKNYDLIISNSDDDIVIDSVNTKILESYEAIYGS